MQRRRSNSDGISVYEICVFAMLAAVMFASKVLMEVLPNIHLLGILTVSYTVVFRKRALIPIYLYVLMNGVFAGFNLWWLPYTYIWTILWGITMLLPRNMPKKIAIIVYSVVCSIHGFAFGILYSPAQALMFGLTFEQTLVWIAAGLPFDLIHGVSNLLFGLLVIPLTQLIERLSKGKIN